MNVSVAKLSKTTKIMTEYGEEVSVTEVEEEKIISEAEADKNMIDLLQEIEKERQKKESKKARAAKKREKKKQKKKQKQEVTETEHGKSKNSSPEVESEEQQLKDENEKEKLVKQPPAATITSTMGSSCVASSTLPKPVLQDIFQPIGAERTMRKTPGPNINTEFKGSSWNYDRDLEKLRKPLDKTKSNQDQLKKTPCEKAREASNPSMLPVKTWSEVVQTKPKVSASANSRVSGRDNSKIHATHEISDANIEKIKASGDTTITVKKGRAAEIREIHQETTQEVLDQKAMQNLQQQLDHHKRIMAEQQEKYLEQTIEAMGMVDGSAIQAPIQAALREAFQKFVIPSFERSIDNMYQQVSDTFRRGTEEYKRQLESHLEGLRQKHLEARGPTVAEMHQLKNSFEQIQSQLKTEVSPATFYEAVREAVRDEVAMAMRELGNLISESVLSAMRSGAVTPVIATSDHQIEKAHIMNLLRQGQFNAAFDKALSAKNIYLVISLCEMVNPSQVFNQSPCPLHQPVLLSLIQQLSVDLENHTDLKHKYLEEAVVNLDPGDSVTQKFMKEVVSTLNQKLRCYIPAHPDDKLTRSLKLLLMASESLLK